MGEGPPGCGYREITALEVKPEDDRTPVESPVTSVISNLGIGRRRSRKEGPQPRGGRRKQVSEEKEKSSKSLRSIRERKQKDCIRSKTWKGG